MSTAAQELHAWVVETIGGVPTTDPRPSFSLTEEGLLTGTTGVNRLVGTYVAEDERIRIDAGMTRMAGRPEAMDQERRLLRALEGWQSFRLADGRLQIGPPDSGLVCTPAQRGGASGPRPA